MRTLFKKYLIASVSIFIVSRAQLGLAVSDNLSSYTYAGLILSILLLIKSFTDTLLFPIHLITLNFSKWLIYLALIYLWSLITPEVKFLSFNFSGFRIGPLIINPSHISYWLSVIIMSLILILTIKFFSWVVK
ncbi:hypothetical protein A3D78_03995 [Candidatus Gottesmanbacteria bacterium RIFCSPHIGHO2_02_FULL_39_14]|uniref:Uncharacterized protein n=3 Tax=Candidatus Gottesmaniibacteriota TaxID=1752720 RepID=A0A1F6A112_9BACT|nr:MAG: hypothetical protein A2153_01265 [Candidatus Gottesmanbacteria bacterium RBG_16_38_7b]OGG18368.1 MAG: hypothetical protein A3D78_03995 [Candidatus Gottesmanbacteria bacterium RIFCSPHIGHO2_02_FULL_39_14]OGG30998.1 MAG: hypothetical protein A3I51_03995 [Candidatus Gottesmanbacteria bacterium RIFCSPLOWO2_02_FULL_38_8]